MVSMTPWVERTFRFDRQPGEFPALLQRLSGTPPRARDLVAGVPEDRLGQRPEGTRWSAKEHIGHLADLQALDDTRLREFLSRAPVLSAADMSNRATESAGHNSTPIETTLRRLSEGRLAWVRQLEALSEEDLLRTALHPRLRQPMRLIDWASFIAEHDDHHLARADEAIRGRGPGRSAPHDFSARRPERSAPHQRELFDIPDGVTYLNCATMSPQLRSVTAAGDQAVWAKGRPWTISAADFFTGVEELRALAAAVAGVEADAIAIVPAASYGIAVAAKNAEVRAGESIVVLDQEFPSNVYAWRALAQRTGARLVAAVREGGESWTDAVLRVMDRAGGNTAVVSVPHCHWTDGSRVDLERVGERARASGALFVVDASQSLGACPLDIGRVQPDFLVAVGYKWLLGPYALGYLYAAPRWREQGVPLEESWLTREGSDDFARLVEYRDEYRGGARRFDMGEVSQFVLAPMAAAALKQILSWTVEHIQRSISQLTDRAAQLAAASGYMTQPATERLGHMIGIRPSGGIPEGLTARLSAARVYVSVRGDSIRVAPHLYNTEADIERLFSVLAR